MKQNVFRLLGCLLALTLFLGLFSGCTNNGDSAKVWKKVERYYDEDFVRRSPHVAESWIETVGDIPRMVVDGKQVDPVLFTLSGTNDVAMRQTSYAVQSGAKIIRVFATASNDYAETKKSLDEVMSALETVKGDYYVMLCYGITASATVFGGDVFEDNYVNQKGHNYPYNSIASDKWMEYAKEITDNLIMAVKENPAYSNRIVAYSPCGSYGGEWFGPNFWNGHYDTSEVCARKFRTYLSNKYKTDAALQKAWGNNGVTLQTATIPNNVPAYHSDDSALPTVLMESQYQNIVDYQDFYSELMASRIVEICQYIKEKNDSRILTASYYGYQYEISIAVSGCLGLETVLDSRYVDILAAPNSYEDRNEGGVGASMTRLSAIAASGKIWLDESDYRSPIQTDEGFTTGESGLGDEEAIATLEHLIEVMKRQYGKNMVYDSGTWWLDLLNRGWFDSEEFWEASADLQELWYHYTTYKNTASPEVAFIWDDDALCMLGKAWEATDDILRDVKRNAHRAGVSFGFYSMEDLLEGRIDDSKLYIFYTPWNITAKQAPAIKKKLTGKTAVWMYGYGKTDSAVFKDITGIQAELSASNRSTNLTFVDNADEILLGLSDAFVSGMDGGAVTVVKDDNATVLAKYDASEEVAVATLEKGKTKSVFYGSTSLPNTVLRALVEYADATVFMNTEDVFYADNSLAVVHATQGGKKTIHFPKVCDVYDYFQNIWYTNVSEITVDMAAYETRYFFYGNQKNFQSCHIG